MACARHAHGMHMAHARHLHLHMHMHMHMHMHLHMHLHMPLQVTRLGLERDMLEAEYARMSLGSGRSAAERRRKVEASAYRLTLAVLHATTHHNLLWLYSLRLYSPRSTSRVGSPISALSSMVSASSCAPPPEARAVRCCAVSCCAGGDGLGEELRRGAGKVQARCMQGRGGVCTSSARQPPLPLRQPSLAASRQDPPSPKSQATRARLPIYTCAWWGDI